MPLIVIASIFMVFGVLAWRDLKSALLLILGLLPAYLLRFTFGIPSTVLEGFIIIATICWLAGYQGWRVSLSSFGRYRAPLFFLLAIATFSVIWAPDQQAALGLWKAYFVEPMLAFIMFRTVFTDRADWVRALNVFGLTVVGLSLLAVCQKVTGLGLPIPWDVEGRATSVFPYPNALGLFIAPIVTAFMVVRSRWSWIVVPAGVLAIVFAETEAALAAIPAALMLTFWLSKGAMKTKLAVSVSMLGLAIVLLALVPAVREKVLLRDYSGGVRRAQWSETVQLLKDRPLQGAGVAGYPTALEPYHDARLYEIFQYPHNVILNFWVEMGVFGVMAFMWVAMVTSKLAWDRRDDVLVLAAFAAVATMTIHGLVDVPFFKNDLAVMTAFFLAMMLLPNKRTKEIV